MRATTKLRWLYLILLCSILATCRLELDDKPVSAVKVTVHDCLFNYCN